MEVQQEVGVLNVLGRDRTFTEKVVAHLRYWRERLIPHVIWCGQEADVVVSFPIEKIDREKLSQVENLLGEMGIFFDTSQGCGERRWECDWALHGPMHISFMSKARNPERRS